MRIPKLRGFQNRFKIEYEVVNVGAIAAAAERGAFESGEPRRAKGKKAAPLITVNQDVLRAVGLVRTLNKPLKILGGGELSAPLFVVADAFTKSARDEDRGRRRHGQRPRDPDRADRGLGVEARRRPRARRTAAGEAARGRCRAPPRARPSRRSGAARQGEPRPPKAERPPSRRRAARPPTPNRAGRMRRGRRTPATSDATETEAAATDRHRQSDEPTPSRRGRADERRDGAARPATTP